MGVRGGAASAVGRVEEGTVVAAVHVGATTDSRWGIDGGVSGTHCDVIQLARSSAEREIGGEGGEAKLREEGGGVTRSNRTESS